jgi:hypothetical protein
LVGLGFQDQAGLAHGALLGFRKGPVPRGADRANPPQETSTEIGGQRGCNISVIHPPNGRVFVGARLKCHPARKVEMTPLADPPRAKRHHNAPLGEGGGVKGCNRLAGARSAALEAAGLTQHHRKAVRPAEFSPGRNCTGAQSCTA